MATSLVEQHLQSSEDVKSSPYKRINFKDEGLFCEENRILSKKWESVVANIGQYF